MKDELGFLWDTITKHGENLWADDRFPLANLDAPIRFFRLKPLRTPRISDAKQLATVDVSPAFKNLRDDILVSLRYHLFCDSEMELVALWAEKLLRFVEVRLPEIKQRSLSKWGDLGTARLQLLHIVVFFLDYCARTGDLRFLNAALKLKDLKWLLRCSRIQHHLSGSGDEVILGYFEFRTLLMTEYLLAQLHNGEKP